MSTMRCVHNVADVFVEYLTAWGVRFVFGIPGGSILPILDVIRRSDSMEFVLVRHESTAAFMASAYAKLTGRLGVCTAITGAGATNLVTGLADAAWDRAPVLAITGQVGQEMIGSGVFQEINQHGLFSSFAAYEQTLHKPEQLSRVLPAAMRTALVNSGVSHIAVPIDLQTAVTCEPVRMPDQLLPSLGAPDPDVMERAVKIIRKSSRPVILAGKAAWSAREEVAALSDLLSAPVATTPAAKGIFDEHSPKALGVLGRLGLTCSIDVFRQADLAILVGADIVEQQLVPRVPTVQITPDPLEVADELVIEAVLVGDVKLTTGSLITQMGERKADGWAERASNIQSSCRQRSAEHVSKSSEPVHPKAVIDALARVIAEDAIICVDIGDVTYWYMQYFLASRQRTLVSSHLASMGFALPAALAAQMEFPDRQVVCIAGDGGFGMSMADFTTAVKYRLPVTVVLFNNNAYSRVMGEQFEAGLCEYAVELVNPNFSEFARSCGGIGIRVEREENVQDAVRLAFQSGLPSIVEVITDPSVQAVPTLPTEHWADE